MDLIGDKNFDTLAEQFNQRIYSTSKGRIRLAVLERDLREWTPELYQGSALQVLDAGGGEGLLARKLASLQHQVTLCDLSLVMLDNARAAAEAAGVASRIKFIHRSIQSFTPNRDFDVVLCHAVLEWVDEPFKMIKILCEGVRPGGKLSLMFYNRHSTVFRSLVRGYLDKVLNDNAAGNGKGLTPIRPLEPEQVLTALKAAGMQNVTSSGVRVFHDYMHRDVRDKRNEADILELELRLSRLEPYRSLGRYIHLVAQKPSNYL